MSPGEPSRAPSPAVPVQAGRGPGGQVVTFPGTDRPPEVLGERGGVPDNNTNTNTLRVPRVGGPTLRQPPPHPSPRPPPRAPPLPAPSLPRSPRSDPRPPLSRPDHHHLHHHPPPAPQPAWRSGFGKPVAAAAALPALRNRHRAAAAPSAGAGGTLGGTPREGGEGRKEGCPGRSSPSTGVRSGDSCPGPCRRAPRSRSLAHPPARGPREKRSRRDGGHGGGQRVKVLLPAASAVDTSPSWIRGTRKFMR